MTEDEGRRGEGRCGIHIWGKSALSRLAIYAGSRRTHREGERERKGTRKGVRRLRLQHELHPIERGYEIDVALVTVIVVPYRGWSWWCTDPSLDLRTRNEVVL